jgi:mannose-6-phosphate isomerase
MTRETINQLPSVGFGNLSDAATWYETWLLNDALPLWWNVGADHERGGFHEALGSDGAPRPGPRRARVQSRQAVVYGTAGLFGWEGPWREAAWHAMDFFLEKFQRKDGLFRCLVGLDGKALDDTAMLYDQGFALLATATLHEADPERGDMAVVAGRIREALGAMRHSAGGYRENIAHPFQANAHMHLLEGAMAWAELVGGDWELMADELVELALDAFIDPKSGVLREFFDANWRPAPGRLGNIVEPGHQFEWAWLLSRHGMRRGSAETSEAAGRLYASGRRGVDLRRGVAINEVTDEFIATDWVARLWPQTERLKAAILFDCEAEIVSAATALRTYLDAGYPGAWRDKLRQDGSFVDEPAPATSLYHVLGACVGLIRAGAR